MFNAIARNVLGSRLGSVSQLSSAELGELIFGRMQPSQQEFFDREYGQHSRIPVRHLPHYLFWRDRESDARNGAYRRFLECTETDHATVDARVADYVNLREKIQAEGVREPLTVLGAPDGHNVLVDGHRRAAIAYALGMDVKCVRVGLKEGLENIVSNQDEFYGTRNANRPYQSIFYGEKELLPGRRRDVLERFHKLDIINHVRGRTVLDLGSNIAVNAMTAWYFGAKGVTAMEVSPKIAAAALQLATVLDSRVRLHVHDLGKPVDGLESCDTVFCFSLFAHVSDKAMLAESIARLTRTTLYFEGHENSREEDYAQVFRHFRSVEHIGYNRDGAHSSASTRPFFRCSR